MNERETAELDELRTKLKKTGFLNMEDTARLNLLNKQRIMEETSKNNVLTMKAYRIKPGAKAKA
jgi:hypothetical protein